MATTAPTRTRLSEIADHTFVTVEARICAVDVHHTGTSRPWATVTLTEAGHLVDVRVYPLAYAQSSQHFEVGNVVTVSGEVACDPDGVFMAAHTIHPAGATA